MFAARSKQANLGSKSDVANFVKEADFDNKLKDVTSNKNELHELSKNVKAIPTKILTKDLINIFSIINGAKYLFSGIFQNYLVFISGNKYIKHFTGTTQIESWKSNVMSKESIENITKSDSNFAPTFIIFKILHVHHHLLADMNFNGHCLIRNNISIPKKVINLYISYTLGPQLGNLNTDYTLRNCLFGSVKLTKNTDLDKYKYTDYRIGFDSRSEFLFTDGSYGKNVIIFGADVSSSLHIDNKGKYILIFGEGPTRGLDDTTLTAEAKHSINLTQQGKDLY